MTWIADPDNLLIVNSTDRQPELIGWYSVSSGLLTGPLVRTGQQLIPSNQAFLRASPALKVNKGLTLGSSTTVGVKRPGSGNDTITLASRQTISSHLPESDGSYDNYFPVTASSAYTFGVTSLGIDAQQRSSTCVFAVYWINISGAVIGVASQGIKSSFGQRVRNSVTKEAPTGTVGAVVSISTDRAVVLTRPSLAINRVDIRQADPVYVGDSFASTNPNLIEVDPETGGSAWMRGWTDEFGVTKTPVVGVLSVDANTEARLYYVDDQRLPVTMGVPVSPSTVYTFNITETPSRTASVVKLKFYDITGTILVGTVIPTAVGTLLSSTFTTSANAAQVAIKITAAGTNTGFMSPTLVLGTDASPDPLPPVFTGVVHCTFQSMSDVLKLRSRRVVSSSDADETLHINTVSQSEALEIVSMANRVSWSDSLANVHKTVVSASDSLHLVGKFNLLGGLQLGTDVVPSDDLAPDDSSRRASNQVESDSDSLETIHCTFISQSDSVTVVSNTVLSMSDSTENAHLTLISYSDLLATQHKLVTSSSDTTHIVPILTIGESDSREVLHITNTLASDTLKTLNKRVQSKSDSTKRRSKLIKSRSSVNAKKITSVVIAKQG